MSCSEKNNRAKKSNIVLGTRKLKNVDGPELAACLPTVEKRLGTFSGFVATRRQRLNEKKKKSFSYALMYVALKSDLVI